MTKLKENRYINLICLTILFIELYILIFFITGAQFNILSKTIIGMLLLIHLELFIGFLFRNHRLIVVYISTIINLLVLSLYLLIVTGEISLFISFFLLASLLLIFNRPFLFLLSKFFRLIQIINNKLWPEDKPFKILTTIGVWLSVPLIVIIFCVWLYSINQDYPENYLEQICIHEAGHAVIAEKLFPGQVSEVVWNPKVTHEFLSSLGLKNISLGYTRHSIEREFLTPKTTEDNVKVLLAGELATRHFYGKNHLAGGGSDIPTAYNIVKKYFILTYSDELGTINRDEHDPKILIDAIKQFVDSQVPETERLIMENGKLIRLVATILKERRQINGDELRKIIKENTAATELN